MRHEASDLKQMQSLPLEYKILMTQERIKGWYESWWRYEIEDLETGKTRFVTFDNRDQYAQPPMKESEWIKSAFPGQVYVSFSGGKDSTVLKHIVDSMYDDVPALFVNTGLEYPEIQKFARSQKNVVVVRPETRFDEVIKKYGYPLIGKEVAQTVYEAKRHAASGKYTRQLQKLNGDLVDEQGRKSMYNLSKYRYLLDAPFDVSHMCCNVMKKKPTKHYERTTGRKGILGTMASESRLRHSSWLKRGCNAFEGKRPSSQPMSFWTEQDVLHYIKEYDLPYCSVYGDIQIKRAVDNDKVLEGQINLIDYLGCYEPEDTLETTGCDRTGCIFCMFGCHLEKEPNRFQRLKETHPKQYNYCINGGEMVDGKWQPNKQGLGLGYVLDYIGVKYD